MEAFDSSAFLSDESHEKEGDLFEAVEGCEPVESLTLSLSLSFCLKGFKLDCFIIVLHTVSHIITRP